LREQRQTERGEQLRGPRGLTALASVEPAVTTAGWLPYQVSQAPGHTASLVVVHGLRAPSAADSARWTEVAIAAV